MNLIWFSVPPSHDFSWNAFVRFGRRAESLAFLSFRCYFHSKCCFIFCRACFLCHFFPIASRQTKRFQTNDVHERIKDDWPCKNVYAIRLSGNQMFGQNRSFFFSSSLCLRIFHWSMPRNDQLKMANKKVMEGSAKKGEMLAKGVIHQLFTPNARAAVFFHHFFFIFVYFRIFCFFARRQFDLLKATKRMNVAKAARGNAKMLKQQKLKWMKKLIILLSLWITCNNLQYIARKAKRTKAHQLICVSFVVGRFLSSLRFCCSIHLLFTCFPFVPFLLHENPFAIRFLLLEHSSRMWIAYLFTAFSFASTRDFDHFVFSSVTSFFRCQFFSLSCFFVGILLKY